jgi:phage terminase large subunit
MIKEAEEDKARDYDDYAHVWLGEYRKVLDGAVYAAEIRKAFSEKRIMRVLPIAGKPVDTFWDLGKRDHTSIWIAQLNMGEYRIIDFIEGRGNFLGHYVDELRKKGYTYGKHYLPHDGNTEKLNAKSIASDLRGLSDGVPVVVLPRMSAKAIGINAARKILPMCYFDEVNTKQGVKRLGQFTYKVDELGSYSKEPLHDENSDAADAFAQMALSLHPEKKTPVVNYNSSTSSPWA